MPEVLQVLTVASNQMNGHLFGEPHYPQLLERVDNMRQVYLNINGNPAFDVAIHLPGGFNLLITAALLMLTDLQERNVLKALRPYYAAILPAQTELRFILHQVEHGLEYWHYAANELSAKINDANDQTYARLPESAQHQQADFLADMLINTFADLLYFMDTCTVQLNQVLEQHVLIAILDGDNSDNEDEFDFTGLYVSQEDSLSVVPESL